MAHRVCPIRCCNSCQRGFFSKRLFSRQAALCLASLISTVSGWRCLGKKLHPTCDIRPPDRRRSHARTPVRWLAASSISSTSCLVHDFRGTKATKCKSVCCRHSPRSGKSLKPPPQNHQALLLADLHRVIDQPRPVVGLGQRHSQQGVAQPQQPQPTGSPVRNRQRHTRRADTITNTRGAQRSDTPWSTRRRNKHCVPTA